MRLIHSPAASVVSTAIVIAIAQGCAHRSQTYHGGASGGECTPSLIVHNNTDRDVEVYEYRAGVKTVIATVSPGTHQLTLATDDPRVSYGAQPVGRTEVLTATSGPRPSDRVRLERVCT
jgi:hypothetical protein